MSRFAGRQSLVDPHSNYTHIQGIDIRDWLALIDGKVSPKLLPVFLHEYTHFWCFCSLVGNAGAIMELKGSYESATADPKDGSRSSFEVSCPNELT